MENSHFIQINRDKNVYKLINLHATDRCLTIIWEKFVKVAFGCLWTDKTQGCQNIYCHKIFFTAIQALCLSINVRAIAFKMYGRLTEKNVCNGLHQKLRDERGVWDKNEGGGRGPDKMKKGDLKVFFPNSPPPCILLNKITLIFDKKDVKYPQVYCKYLLNPNF